MNNLIVNFKDIVAPFLAALGIRLLTNHDDHIHLSVEVNSIGFYIILISITWFSVWSLNRVWRRIKEYYKKFQSDNLEEITKKTKRNCGERG